MITPDQRRIVEAYIEVSNKSSSLDSHLRRVYQAVKTGEWTFEDFKDFVSVVRNEAKISTSINEDLSREERIELLKKNDDVLGPKSKALEVGATVRVKDDVPRLGGLLGTVIGFKQEDLDAWREEGIDDDDEEGYGFDGGELEDLWEVEFENGEVEWLFPNDLELV